MKSMRRDWPSLMDRLNDSRKGLLNIHMGSPGSAQVTRVRLLRAWNGISAHTQGPWLKLALLRP